VGLSLKGLNNYIRIEGHTDNLPISSSDFPSNWELSAARATNVVRFLLKEDGLPPDKISEAGYGEFRPIATNDSEAGRSRNRRVDIVILNSKQGVAEPH
jgi:chemotaxis protein MotB